ncbi:MAG TPA: hypothetical protein PK239_07110 [Chitinophagales bacterium]|nr:hypothetical protein [Chitinophagales bacterium]HRK27045.1 hypothetical protein [Chitinophagales bacterium]
MYLEKVLILPTDDAALACEMLRSYIKQSKKILMIVLGDDTRARNAVSVADRAAGIVSDPRWVVWVRSRKAAKAALQELKILESSMLKDWQKVLVLSVNFKATICGVVTNESDLSSVSAFAAYNLAEENANKEGTAVVTPLPETLV